MNEIKIFENKEFGEIRTVMIGGKFYAVGIDVAKALGYAKPGQAVIDHCKGIRKLGMPSEGGIQETNCIPEGDMYRLVVKAADQSRNQEMKAKAERFERWIFDEVLPSIRQTGTYSTVKQVLLTEHPGEVANLIKAVTNRMDKQGSAPYESMDVVKLLCAQYGIQLPKNIVKRPEYEQMELWDFPNSNKKDNSQWDTDNQEDGRKEEKRGELNAQNKTN